MTYQAVPTIQFLIGDDKVDEQARVDRGVAVGDQAPKSQLYLTHDDLKTAADDVVIKGKSLKTLMDAFTAADAAYKKARTALVTSVFAFDGSYDVFVALAEKYCITADDGTSLGLEVRSKVKNPLAPPLGITATYDAGRNRVRIHIQRAPGMRTVAVEVSTDPSVTGSWRELDGSGALHFIPNPAKGTLLIRAASRTARAKSDYTTPISIIIP